MAAAVLGFFVVTLDAVVVNVALPSIRAGLGGGIAGLQWVVDGYTLPMMLVGLVLTPFSARIVEGFGARWPIVLGLFAMTVGLGVFALLPAATPLLALSMVMVLVGLGGPLTMPPMTAVLLNHVPAETTGVASGVFNTSRQLGGALSVAVFGALLANSASFMDGLREALLLAAALLLITTLASTRLPEH